MSIKVVGIDIAKNLFQVYVLSTDGQILSNRKVNRDRLIDTVRQVSEQTALAMESCATSNHWGRIFQELGFRVALIPAQHVKAFVRRQKTTPMMRELFAKPFLDPTFILFLLSLLSNKTSKRYAASVNVWWRTDLANQIRGLAVEYGVVFPLSAKALRSHLPLAIEDAENELSPVMRNLLQTLYCEFVSVSESIGEITQEIALLSQRSPRYEAIRSIPGFGPILTAALISEVGTGKQFPKWSAVLSVVWTGSETK
ncbi:COG3547 Transposase and inactivated derivatives [Vibrio sp. B1FLJ16]|nr:COG3547 Transposase and inactivated derivatives [Vibrio sp. B1FLJ16]CAE6939026.1 COG3547 Transposase and inactivated derivatives [Vibrio sp. B1FLJ16]